MFGRKTLLMTSTITTIVVVLAIAIISNFNVFYAQYVFILAFLITTCFGLVGVSFLYVVELVDPEDVSTCTSIRWLGLLVSGTTFRYMLLGIGI